MCVLKCKKSKSKACKCECGGLFHGILNRSSREQWEYLHSRFPAGIPIKLHKPTLRGTKEGKIHRFFWGKIRWYVVLQKNNEIVALDNISISKEKNK
jgi:hypothetical protein